MTALEDPRWLALSEERRDALLEKYRNTNVEYDGWWDGVYEQFVESCTEKGICVDTHDVRTVGGKTIAKHSIHFSGFWSQGDGACFEGRVDDWPKFFAAAGYPELVDLYEKLTEPLSLSWTHSGHYYHSNSVSFEDELQVVNPHDEDEDPFRYGVWEQVFQAGLVFDKRGEDFIEFIRSLMDQLYKDLEEEHDYLTDDERVVEYILDYCEGELVEDEDEGEEEEEVSLEH
jgi:hypothetical protein